jgi:transcriptional regulator with XRE-family HTH domain
MMNEVNEDYNKIIGTRVKMLRITKGVSQTELAKQIGVTQTHLSNIENGRAGLTIPNLIRLHEALETPISSFFEDFESQGESESKNDVSIEDITELLRLLKSNRI